MGLCCNTVRNVYVSEGEPKLRIIGFGAAMNEFVVTHRGDRLEIEEWRRCADLENCAATFRASPPNKRFCSPECRERMTERARHLREELQRAQDVLADENAG